MTVNKSWLHFLRDQRSRFNAIYSTALTSGRFQVMSSDGTRVDFLVPVVFRPLDTLHPCEAYCDGARRARFAVSKPVTDPPLDGPDEIMFCIECAAEFIAGICVGTVSAL